MRYAKLRSSRLTCLFATETEEFLDGAGVEFDGVGDFGEDLVERVRRPSVEQDANGAARSTAVTHDRDEPRPHERRR